MTHNPPNSKDDGREADCGRVLSSSVPPEEQGAGEQSRPSCCGDPGADFRTVSSPDKGDGLLGAGPVTVRAGADFWLKLALVECAWGA